MTLLWCVNKPTRRLIQQTLDKFAGNILAGQRHMGADHLVAAETTIGGFKLAFLIVIGVGTPVFLGDIEGCLELPVGHHAVGVRCIYKEAVMDE